MFSKSFVDNHNNAEMEQEEKSNVPDWDGDPSTWNEFVVSMKCHVLGMKGGDRPLAAARIARKLLQSSNQSGKRLVQKLEFFSFHGNEMTRHDIQMSSIRGWRAWSISKSPVKKSHEVIPHSSARACSHHCAMPMHW